MNRSSLPHQSRRLAVHSFLILSVLLLLTSFNPWATTSATAAGTYTLNKFVYPGSTNITLPTSTNPNLIASNPTINTWSIGVPILYVITIQDPSSSTTPTNITLKDDLGIANNPHFHLLNVTCNTLFGAPSCGPLPAAGSPLPLTFTPQLIGGGEVVVQILGYYDAVGTYTNDASILLPGGTTPVANQTKTVTIPGDWSKIDLGVAKTSATSDTSLPGTIHYTVTLTGDPTQDFYPGNLLQLRDTVKAAVSPLPAYVLAGFTCSNPGGSTCPNTPASAPQSASFSGGNYFADFFINWPAGTIIKKGDTLTLKFDLQVSTAATCGPKSNTIENQAAIQMNGFAYSDFNGSNNVSTPLTSNAFTTGLSDCPAATPIATAHKERLCPKSGCPPVKWGDTVKYQITIKNNTSLPQLMQFEDLVYKSSITVPLKASLSPSGTGSDVQCVPSTISCTTTPTSPQNLIADQQSYSLFKTRFTLPKNGQVALVFEVKIDQLVDCQTDPRNTFVNYGNLYGISGASPEVATFVAQTEQVGVDLPELLACKLKVTKRLDSPTNGVTFGQPVSYTITYENQDPTQAMTVNTLRDFLNMRDPSGGLAYGNIPISGLAVSCASTSGVAPLPITNQSVTQISASGPDWLGNGVIQEPAGGITFPPNSQLVCTVSFTPQAPPNTDNLCQGRGKPEILNTALFDLSVLNWNTKPSAPFLAQAAAPLPLCRKVVVGKTPMDAAGNAISSTGPGGLLTFQIKVTNFSPDPVDNFVLTDQLPAGFTAGGPVTCTSPCTSAPITGTPPVVNATFSSIPGTGSAPANTVILTFKVNAPIAGGTYKNTAVGSFTSDTNPSGTHFYFEGDPKVLLENSAEVQVLTPVLTKKFNQSTIAVNGTAAITFTITNMNSDPAQTGISFTDLLPSGVTVLGAPSSACGGQVSVSGGNAVSLANGQLAAGQHTCEFSVEVKASACGKLVNDRTNFSKVTNLDVSGVNAQLEVTGCPVGGGLTVQKIVKGAPRGFQGQFNFLVQCATPKGFYRNAVTVNWPTPGFVTLNDVPANSQCTVTEGPAPASLPANYNWDGLPSYSPEGGVVTIGPRGGGQVTVTNTLSLCNETGQVTITKIVKGLPKDYIGKFEGTLQCWTGDTLVTYPVTLVSPNGLSTTIGNIPLGSTCTFQETGQPPLTGDLKWNAPVYSPKFGTVTLTGECCQQITVTNEARHCCSQSGGAESGSGHNYSQPATEAPAGYATPSDRPPVTKRKVRGTQK